MPNVQVVSSAESKPVPGIVVRVSKQASTLTVIDAAGKVIMHAPVTSGSEHDPLPIGTWTVTAVARNPNLQLQPGSVLGCRPAHAKARIPPGRTVRSAWCGSTSASRTTGIHGTPEPSTVGHTASHGCVRLTNWDALRLAALVGKGTTVEFVE